MIGYARSIFVNHQGVEKFTCILCENVLRNPVNTPQGCEFCKSCVFEFIKADSTKKRTKDGSVKCPKCNDEHITTKSLNVNKRSRDCIEEFPTKCPNSENEFPCPWEGTVLNYEEHTANCPMEASTCAACELRCCFDGCNGTILRRDRELHFELTLPRVMDKLREVNVQNDVLGTQVAALETEVSVSGERVSELEAEVRSYKAQLNIMLNGDVGKKRQRSTASAAAVVVDRRKTDETLVGVMPAVTSSATPVDSTMYWDDISSGLGNISTNALTAAASSASSAVPAVPAALSGVVIRNKKRKVVEPAAECDNPHQENDNDNTNDDSSSAKAVAMEHTADHWYRVADVLLREAVEVHGYEWQEVSDFIFMNGDGREASADECKKRWGEISHLRHVPSADWTVQETAKLYTLKTSATDEPYLWDKISRQLEIRVKDCATKWETLLNQKTRKPNIKPLKDTEVAVIKDRLQRDNQSLESTWQSLAKQLKCNEIHLRVRWQLYIDSKEDV